jgi:DNA-binding response OmpR family regulator
MKRIGANMEQAFKVLAAPTGLSVVFADPDSPSILHLAGALHGCHVTLVGSAYEAWRVVTARRAHVLVTELDLPDQSGGDLIRRVRTTPATREVLFIALTSRNSIASKVSALQAGAHDYLVKPVTAQEFVLHLRRILHFRQVIRG